MSEPWEHHEELRGLIGRRVRFPLEKRYKQPGCVVEGICEEALNGGVVVDDGVSQGRWVLTPERLSTLEVLD
jgi:hypothetical protein